MINRFYGENLRNIVGEVFNMDVDKDELGCALISESKFGWTYSSTYPKHLNQHYACNQVWLSFKYKNFQNFVLNVVLSSIQTLVAVKA